jgi:hypothetical protein
MIRTHRLAVHTALLGAALLAGCAGRNDALEPTTQPTTLPGNVEESTPGYWFAKPAVDSVSGLDFDRLMDVAEREARDRHFAIDRRDYRQGLLTTVPMVSAQWFEVWRPDVSTLDDAAESSLATVRRSIRFEIARGDGGQFVLTPKVLVERQAVTERQLSDPALYRQAFARTLARGSRSRDQGLDVAQRYWYAIGRDEPFERRLAESLRRRLAER